MELACVWCLEGNGARLEQCLIVCSRDGVGAEAGGSQATAMALTLAPTQAQDRVGAAGATCPPTLYSNPRGWLPSPIPSPPAVECGRGALWIQVNTTYFNLPVKAGLKRGVSVSILHL